MAGKLIDHTKYRLDAAHFRSLQGTISHIKDWLAGKKKETEIPQFLVYCFCWHLYITPTGFVLSNFQISVTKSSAIEYRINRPKTAMRAVRYHGRGDIRVDQIDEPVCGDGEVKVRYYLLVVPSPDA